MGGPVEPEPILNEIRLQYTVYCAVCGPGYGLFATSQRILRLERTDRSPPEPMDRSPPTRVEAVILSPLPPPSLLFGGAGLFGIEIETNKYSTGLVGR